MKILLGSIKIFRNRKEMRENRWFKAVLFFDMLD